MRRAVVLLVIVLAAGCGAKTANAPATTGAPATTSTTAAPAAEATVPLGQPQTHPHGEVITVHSTMDPVVPNQTMYQEVPASMRLVAADVEVCGTEASAEQEAEPFDFELRTNTNRMWAYWPSGKFVLAPGFDEGPTGPSCVRGWVTYQVDTAESVTAVVFGKNDPLVWTI